MIPNEFDFDGSQRYLDVKKVNDLLYKSRLHGWNFTISNGVNLPAFIPDKSLPVKFQVSADPIQTYGKKSSVVISKGTIVAVDSIKNSATYSSNGSNDEHGITPSGIVRVGTDVFGNPISAGVNDEGVGYGTTLNGGFVTIANGGVAVNDKYTQTDVDEGVYKQDGSLAAVDDDYARGANIPVGIALNNMFIDDKGKVYNYSTQILELNTIQTDMYVTFPFVNTGAGITLDKFSLSQSGGDQTFGAAYSAVKNDFNYLWGDLSGVKSGTYVSSDFNGKFVIQDKTNQLTVSKNVQTVGKLVLMDNIYPKEKLSEVITYGQVTGDPTWQGLGVTGSDLNGIPVTLYILAWKILQAQTSSTPTLGDIQSAIEAGAFGYAKINLHVS